MKHDEGWTEAADKTRLYWQRHTPDDTPRAALLFVHGLAEHSGRYGHVMRHFAEVGFDCWAVDYRGHGKSPGLRVHVDRFDEFLLPRLEGTREDGSIVLCHRPTPPPPGRETSPGPTAPAGPPPQRPRRSP